jgi:uncharacterized protein (DUF952 family)
MIGPPPNPEFIYKIVSRPAFEAARSAKAFPLMPIDLADGYVHFSTAAQLAETLRLYFAGQTAVVFDVQTSDLSDLRWEPSRGGQLFPHAYGEVSASAVGETAELSVSGDGSVTLPAWVR